MAGGNLNIGTAFLEVDAEVKKDATSKITKEMESAGQSSSNAFTKAFSEIKGKLIKAFGAYEIGKKVAQTIFDSVSAYADYEQLLGGVKKIFDQADQVQILKDAQAAYMDLNMSVNQYLSAINTVGARFAATMGDQKGYDIARKGMMAIADYASGTGENLEELNQKYGLITRSTSSYLSIADQFSSLLPQTTDGFLKEAQAAGFLSDKYKKLTDVPIAEYQEAVTLMLERGVEKMNLLGNTAAEATQTLSGSIAAMKAAWENWLVSLSDPDANGEEATRALMDTIKTVIHLAAPTIGEALGNLIGQLPEIIVDAIPDVLLALEKLILKFGEKILEWKDNLFTNLGNWVAELVNGTEEGADKVVDATAEGVDGAVEEVKRLPRETDAALANLDYSDSGYRIGHSFARGLLNSITEVSNAAMQVALAADAPFPHSPAKIGPFSGRGWTLYSGESVADAFAEGFTRRMAAVQAQIASGMGGIASTISRGTVTTYNIDMSVTADSTTTLDSLISQARRARALNGGY